MNTTCSYVNELLLSILRSKVRPAPYEFLIFPLTDTCREGEGGITNGDCQGPAENITNAITKSKRLAKKYVKNI